MEYHFLGSMPLFGWLKKRNFTLFHKNLRNKVKLKTPKAIIYHLSTRIDNRQIMSDKSNYIIASYPSGSNVLFVTENRNLYIVGDNSNHKTGIQQGSRFETPQILSVKLNAGENVSKFVSHSRKVFIFTDKNRLMSLPTNNTECYSNFEEINSQNSENSTNLDDDPDDESDIVEQDLEDLQSQRFAWEGKFLAPQTNVKVSPDELINWQHLDQISYAKLPRKQQHIYQKCARHFITEHYDKLLALNEEVSFDVLEQVANPIPAYVQDLMPSDEIQVDDLLLTQSMCLEYPVRKALTSIPEEPGKNLPEMYHSYEGVSRQGILFEQITQVVFGISSNFYRIKDKIVVEVFNFTDDFAIDGSRMSVRPYNQFPDCYEICSPFQKSEWIFTTHLIYLRHNGMYHILLPIANKVAPFIWIYFPAEFEIQPESIHWSSDRIDIYVIHDNTIYTYQHFSKRLLPFISCEVPHILSHHNSDTTLAIMNDKAIYLGSNFKLLRETPADSVNDVHSEILSNLVDIHYHSIRKWTVVLIFEEPMLSDVLYSRKVLCLNVSGVKYYGLIMNSCTVFIRGSDLYIVTRIRMDSFAQGIQGLKHRGGYHTYIRRLPFNESEILSCVMNGSIVIHIRNMIYYMHRYDMFEVRSVNLHDIRSQVPDWKQLKLVNRAMTLSIVSGDSSGSSNWSLRLNSRTPFKLMELIRNMNARDNVNIRVDSISGSSSGGGGKKIFFDYTMRRFANIFFKKHNVVLSLNLDAFSSYTDADLLLMGKMLAFVYNNYGKFPIRIPLLILAAIQKRPPTRAALEFFAQHEDLDALKTLQNIKDFSETGYDNYHDALRCICHYDNFSDEEKHVAYGIACTIANGFLRNCTTNNTHQMNLPTLDYCFSGDFTQDIDSFVRRIIFSDTSESQKADLMHYIQNLSQNKFRKLLINWSGSSTIMPHKNYTITITNSSTKNIISFGTCFNDICLHDRLFTFDRKLWNQLLLGECMAIVG